MHPTRSSHAARALPLATLALPLATLAAPGAARAQRARPPHVCTATRPLDLVATSRSSGVSAVVTTPQGGSSTLWVLFSAQDAQGQESASLLRVGGIEGDDLTLMGAQRLGPGYVTQGGLAAAGDNLLAAYVRPDQHVSVNVRPLVSVAGSAAPTDVSLEAPEAPAALSVGAVGGRALVAWDDGAQGLRYAWLDERGALAGDVQRVPGRYDAPAVTPAFGGALLFRDVSGRGQRLGLLRAAPGARPTVARATATVDAVSAISAGAAGGDPGAGASVVYTGGDSAHLAVLGGDDGAGTDRVLGGADVATQTALATTPWGAFAAWTRGGQIWFTVVGADGSRVTEEFVVSGGGPGERARVPAMAAFGDSAVVVWSASGVAGASGTGVRMVRVTCR